MKEIVLPKIVAAGVFNAELMMKNMKESKKRKTTMFELELPIGEGGLSHMDEESAEIGEDLIICAKPGQVRHTRLPFRCYYVHMIVQEGALCDLLMRLPSYIRIEDRARYEALFRDIHTLCDSALERDRVLLQSRVLELVALLGERGAEQEISGKPGHKEMIERVIDYIRDNLAADLSLGTVAAYASFSPTYFHHCFKRSTGRTLHEYVEEQRIRAAIHLLVSTDMTLSAVALECGFSSQAYFSYAFKKRMGVTPREYVEEVWRRYKE